MKFSPRSLAGLILLGATTILSADYPAEVLADNPVAYWRLDDADGTNVADSSGNGNDGAVDGFEGSITFGETGLLPSEAANGSITLAGFDRIIVPGFEKIGPNGHSAEYWVNVTAYPTACCDNLVGDGEGGGDFFFMNYLIGPGQGDTGAIRPHYSFGNTPVSLTTTNPNVLALDTTYHVVTTWDPTNPNNNNGKIWVNGILWLEGNVSGNVPGPGGTGANPIFIGRDNRENRPSNFKIDEIALYDYPLTPERIAVHFAEGTGGIVLPTNYEEEVLFDNPLAYWRLGEAAGPTAVDASGNGRDATADAGVSFGESSLIPPDADTAIALSGDSGVTSPGFQKSDTGTTLDFWVQFNAAPVGGVFSNLVGDREGGNDFHLMVEAGGAGIIRATVQTESGTTSVDSSEALVDGRMHHVVATWDAATGDLLLYIDGAEAASGNQPGPAGVANTDHPVFIGGEGPAGPGFDGVIDEVAVYDFALAPDRIAARFNRVDVPPPPPPPIDNGPYAEAVLADSPLAYWRLDEPDGSIVYDRSGNDHHGAQDGSTGSISYGGESLVPAEAGNGSISLAGFDRLLFPGFEKVGAGGWTVEYWVKVTAFPGVGGCCDNFVGDGESPGDFHMMNYLIDDPQGDQGAIRPHFNGTSTIALTTTTPNVLELDTVYHVVTNWDRIAGTGNIYVNSQLWLSGPVTGNAINTDNPIFIGRDGRENRPSNFMIDEVALYPYPLTEEQIQSHYDLGISSEPVKVRITQLKRVPGTDTIVIGWESKPGKAYNLRSVIDPSTADPIDWPIYLGNMDIAAVPPENTVIIDLPADQERYFVIEEFVPPPLKVLADGFEAGQGAWTAGSDGDPGTDWQLGAPTVVGPPAANTGANCFGTNIGGDYGGMANVWLRSPALDLTGATAATLNYAQFTEIETMFDGGTVSVLDAADDSLLEEIQSGVEGSTLDWEDVSLPLPAAALGKSIKIEFRFQSDGFGELSGWYLDDFCVTVP